MARKDPYGTYLFEVEIEGLIVGGFSEVSGLVIETEHEKKPEGGLNFFQHTVIKQTKMSSDLTFKRGMTDNDILWNWYQQVIFGLVIRKSGTIIMKSQNGMPGKRWSFFRAVPVKWEGPSFNASSSQTAVETFTLAHDGLFRI